MVRKTVRPILAVLVLVLALSGCATWQTATSESPEKQYLAARMEFNNTLTRYLMYKSRATQEQQAQWTEDYDHLFREGAIILDAWGLYLEAGNADLSYEKQMEFIEFKNTLIDLLVEAKVFE
jgi:hypothetical protein